MKGGIGEVTRTDSVNTGHGNAKQAEKELCKECNQNSNFVLNSHNIGHGNAKSAKEALYKECDQNNNFVLNSHNTTWKSPYETLNKMLPQTLNTKPSTSTKISIYAPVDVTIKKVK